MSARQHFPTGGLIVAGWERLRPLYNGVLAAAVVLLGSGHLDGAAFWFLVVWGAVKANFCFLAGPLAEYACVRFGVYHQVLRPLILGVGLVLALKLTASAVLGFEVVRD